MIIVSGGLGFIGNELVRQLKNSGKEVMILDNRNRVAPDIKDLDTVPVSETDIADFKSVLDLFREIKPEIVYHLAAIHYIPECNDNPERTLRVNVEGTQSILRASSIAGVKKLVYASSGAIYADSEKYLSEKSDDGPVDIYGWSKKFGEDLCHFNALSGDLSIVVCRLFNNYGPRETNLHIIPEIIRQLRTGNVLKLGKIDTVRDYIHTSDCAKALIKLSDCCSDPLTTVNVATGFGYTVEELIKIIGELTGRELKIEPDEKRFRKNDKKTQIASIGKLKELTSWEPEIKIHEGVKALLKYESII